MIKKITILGILILGWFSFSQAQVIQEEHISVFNVLLEVNPDASINVQETIIYNTGAEPHHGIFRDIRLKSAQGNRLSISDISVTNESVIPYQFDSTDGWNLYNLKIGDPETTFTGQKTYVIKYKINNAISYFKDFDELYWNATGNEWDFPILNARATIILPEGAQSIQAECYYGVTGSKDTCENRTNTIDGREHIIFETETTLNSGEGLTIAAGFPKGVVYEPTTKDKVTTLLKDYFLLIFVVLIPIGVFIKSYKRWKMYGRDPKGTGVIVPQYDAPQNLTPLESGIIMSEYTKDQYISAEIVSLAVRGYIKIKAQEEQAFVKTITNFTLIKLKEADESLEKFDQDLLNSLFIEGNEVQLNDLKYKFYKYVSSIKNSANSSLVTKGFYIREPMKARGQMIIGILMIFFSLFFGVFLIAVLQSIYFSIIILALIIACVISGIIVTIFGYFMPARTQAGVAMKEYIEGLKMYLDIAEKDRIDFHNAPEKKPELFEKLLPYAMILGVEKAWAQEFEGIYTTQPSWYEGTSGHAFSTGFFVSQLHSFNTAAVSSMASPSSSGSGGGGSSGGGGGGGGGGSW